jgi:hypothetical protein
MKVTQMLSGFVVKAAFLAAAFSTVNGAPKQATTSANNKVVASESVGQTAVRTGAAPVPTVVATVNGTVSLISMSNCCFITRSRELGGCPRDSLSCCLSS